ncbi:uncharacterized protein BHQ10_009890 [Talaromyces amestolkiae]|uniref:BTB domain-containing protein n=1 Tax=Talaromyces amestolkiae TaxID=1196081 RepID=A0A364LDI9_TALAM|nr:uncharacterized protein BHQ10_009890 [Talaromyces amestolkiae]RAO73878.1 hypothetical protein BHQ10_009890 [Talaromyces amestolkiae]
MVVHYLYHLDYSPNLGVGQEYTNGYTTGAHERDGQLEMDAHHEAASEDAVIEESSSAQGLDESAPIKTISKNAKKNKKKHKRLSSASALTATTQANGASVTETGLSNGAHCAKEYVLPIEAPSPSSLVVHAKVYALSKKYNINELKALALEKFRVEADQDWDTGDFLLAAKEVYTSTSAADQDIRDAVTTIVYEHPEILDRDETQELIKGLDLGFDVLKRVRAKGGFH